MDISIRWVEWNEHNMAQHPVSSVNGALSNGGSGIHQIRDDFGSRGCVAACWPCCVAEETEG